MTEGHRNYKYDSPEHTDAHGFLLPLVNALVREHQKSGSTKIFELGCGNGAVANFFAKQGYDVTGIDYSDSAIRVAREHFPLTRLEAGSVYDDLASKYGKFSLVLSLEVLEHLYFPRQFARTMFDLLEPNGIAIISTPYHGYLKNLVMALSGKMDDHFTVLWDGGHIKFWSIRTISILLKEAGFEVLEVHRVGRIPPLAKSMVICARKPGPG